MRVEPLQLIGSNYQSMCEGEKDNSSWFCSPWSALNQEQVSWSVPAYGYLGVSWSQEKCVASVHLGITIGLTAPAITQLLGQERGEKIHPSRSVFLPLYSWLFNLPCHISSWLCTTYAFIQFNTLFHHLWGDYRLDLTLLLAGNNTGGSQAPQHYQLPIQLNCLILHLTACEPLMVNLWIFHGLFIILCYYSINKLTSTRT